MLFFITKSLSTYQTFLGVLFFCLASVFCIFSYASFEPILVSFFFLILGLFVISLRNIFFSNIILDINHFFFIFSMMYLAVGIGAIFYIFLGDKKNLIDALYFFEMSKGDDFQGNTPAEIRNFTEGSLGLYIWIKIYNLFEILLLKKGIYIGLITNAFNISLAGIIAISSSRLMYGRDRFKEILLTFLISFNGIFLLFSGVYLRDSFIILSLSILYYSWIRYLSYPSIINLIFLFLINASSTFLLPYLRFEYGLIPIALTLLGISLIFFFKNKDETINPNRWLILFGLLIFLITAYLNFSEIFIALFSLSDGVDYISARDLLSSGREGYQEGIQGEAASDSFGLFLTQLPIYLQIFLMPLYMIFFPLPFWVGFESGSAYGFFKSFNVLLMYLFIPLLVLSTWKIIKGQIKINLSIYFNLFVFYVFLMAVSMTSGEGRHLGGFWIPAYLTALSLDLKNIEIRVKYNSILSVLLFLVLGAHLLWILLKVIVFVL